MKITNEIPKPTVGGQVLAEAEFSFKNSPEAFAAMSSNLYSDPRAAIIRELSCNAVDAHQDMLDSGAREEDIPYQISLPNKLSPEFRIRDFGTGLSHKDVMKLYLTYFDSTKSENDNQIGAFGLGSKSPLGYCNNFAVTSYYEGVKRYYLVYINERGIPALIFNGEDETDEPSGMEIVVPCKENDAREWIDAAKRTFMYFEKLPEFVNYDFNPHSVKVIEECGSCKLIESPTYENKWVVVQGNVAYPIERVHFDSKYYPIFEFSGIMTLPIGSVMMMPSREGLNYNEGTIKAITKGFDELVSNYRETVFNRINGFDNTKELCSYLNDAVVNFNSFYRRLGLGLPKAVGLAAEKARKLWIQETGITSRIKFNLWFYGTECRYANQRVFGKTYWQELFVKDPIIADIVLDKNRVNIAAVKHVNYNKNTISPNLDFNERPNVPKVKKHHNGQREFHRSEHCYVIINDTGKKCKARVWQAVRNFPITIPKHSTHMLIYITDDVTKKEAKQIEAFKKRFGDRVTLFKVSEMDIPPLPNRRKRQAGEKKTLDNIPISCYESDNYKKYKSDFPEGKHTKQYRGISSDEYAKLDTVYWTTYKGYKPSCKLPKFNDDPKRFCAALSIIGLTDYVFMVGENNKDFVMENAPSNWVYIDEDLDTVLKQHNIKEQEWLKNAQTSIVYGFADDFQRFLRYTFRHNIDEIKNKDFISVVNRIPERIGSTTYNIDQLLVNTKEAVKYLTDNECKNSDLFDNKDAKQLEKEIEMLYNNIPGLLFIVNNACYSSFNYKEDITKLINSFNTGDQNNV